MQCVIIACVLLYCKVLFCVDARLPSTYMNNKSAASLTSFPVHHHLICFFDVDSDIHQLTYFLI